MSPEKPKSAKVMLLGDIGVGKSSLARRFVFDRFESDYKTTIGVDVLTHDVDLGAAFDNARMRFVLWDTDGDFGNRIFETVYLAGASAAIVVLSGLFINNFTAWIFIPALGLAFSSLWSLIVAKGSA
ncbi:MAG: hypothetical protein N2444_02095, partial [Methylocystis sp.]|nr:hypothetical protein [Methylocystis sp.]